jgi:peptidoglycan hydrolase CwlO-like protein
MERNFKNKYSDEKKQLTFPEWIDSLNKQVDDFNKKMDDADEEMGI